ncbi:MAG: bifunctional phosphoglucose/phosphomannose isomerase [Candidatus Omnitrophica bacterium]|nr:bifunctional phosphoglucose/phosphomannose isomerase [Candidatus Omnitrophota bacterium]MCM8817741.1 bifunctional phosphoglucose/phosphomannose isomerase [Candidatus Omnitrophota bacterium]
MILENRDLINKIDKSDMLSLLENFDSQCLKASSIDVGKISPDVFDHIIFAGMGGSAIVGDILKQIVEVHSKIPFIVHRNYGLPPYATSKTLIFTVSYSGNTEETLSAFKEAMKLGCKIISLSSGGELEKISKKQGIKHIKIPSGQPPRCSLGYMFFPLAKLLEKFGYIEKVNTMKIVEMARSYAKIYGVDSMENKAKEIAKVMHGKNVIVYSGELLASAALRWKTQIAENSKQMTSINFFPELNHNEIMAWNFPFSVLKNCVVFLLRDKDDNDRIRLRMDLTIKIIREKGIQVYEVESEGQDIVERIFSLIILGDWISFYLALLNGVDPTEIKEISYLKKELAST